MFPLRQRIASGYRFGQKTFYNTKHLGVDYRAIIGTPVYAPVDGKVVSRMIGVQGGLTVWFRPNNADVIMRFMHLSRFGKNGPVKKNDIIAYTGNSGKLTTAPHLHLDISKKAVNINNFYNFLDPEKYAW